MRKPAKDPIREDRIHNEAIVDAYGPEEKAMSWYYYPELAPIDPDESTAKAIGDWHYWEAFSHLRYSSASFHLPS